MEKWAIHIIIGGGLKTLVADSKEQAIEAKERWLTSLKTANGMAIVGQFPYFPDVWFRFDAITSIEIKPFTGEPGYYEQLLELQKKVVAKMDDGNEWKGEED